MCFVCFFALLSGKIEPLETSVRPFYGLKNSLNEKKGEKTLEKKKNNNNPVGLRSSQRKLFLLGLVWFFLILTFPYSQIGLFVDVEMQFF